MTPLRETIGYILTHNIIYSTQYELIEYGKAGEQLEKLLASEMGKFAEWVDVKAVRNGYHEWTVGAGNEKKHYTTEQLIELYLNRNK